MPKRQFKRFSLSKTKRTRRTHGSNAVAVLPETSLHHQQLEKTNLEAVLLGAGNLYWFAPAVLSKMPTWKRKNKRKSHGGMQKQIIDKLSFNVKKWKII